MAWGVITQAKGPAGRRMEHIYSGVHGAYPRFLARLCKKPQIIDNVKKQIIIESFPSSSPILHSHLGYHFQLKTYYICTESNKI